MLTVDQLPAPRHEYGYPWSQLEDILDLQDLARLRLWLEGQTMTWNEKTGEGVVYGDDLRRFVQRQPAMR